MSWKKEHGESRPPTPEFTAWTNMKLRCGQKSGHNSKYYFGRGISVCSRWKDYQKFLADMGRRPTTDHSIDRINNDQGYSPENCRWATRSQQMKNRRKFNGIFTH